MVVALRRAGPGSSGRQHEPRARRQIKRSMYNTYVASQDLQATPRPTTPSGVPSKSVMEHIRIPQTHWVDSSATAILINFYYRGGRTHAAFRRVPRRTLRRSYLATRERHQHGPHTSHTHPAEFIDPRDHIHHGHGSNDRYEPFRRSFAWSRPSLRPVLIVSSRPHLRRCSNYSTQHD